MADTRFDLLLRDCRLPDGQVADIGCRAGLIAEIGALAGRAAAREIRCERRAVTSGLVDAHIHLDKALLSERAPGREGSLAEASA
jgi:cytosine deaminase